MYNKQIIGDIYERDTIKGDFNGDGNIEYAIVTNGKIDTLKENDFKDNLEVLNYLE